MGKPRVGAVRELPPQRFVVYPSENRCNLPIPINLLVHDPQNYGSFED